MNNNIFSRLGEVREQVMLADYTTFMIGGPADYFYEAKSEEQIVKAVNIAKESQVPYFVLGGGSNLLVSDAGFRGLVIKISTHGCEIKDGFLIVQAGMPTAYVVNYSQNNNLTGLEFLSGVPGTIGGAVICNARAHFTGNFLDKPICIGNIIDHLKIITTDGSIKEVTGENYTYSLSESSIKQSGDIVLSVGLILHQEVTQEAKQYLKDYTAYRKDKPYCQYPTPGSIFQNPPAESAGKLIDQCGLRGTKIGNAQISPVHGNFIVNLGAAKAADVIKLITLCKERVQNKFGISLIEEICLIGFNNININKEV